MAHEADLLIVGAGPAGLSAAITARRRNKTVAVIGKEETSYKLRRAHRVDNYPGIPAVTGTELALRLREHAADAGAVLMLDAVQSLAPGGNFFAAFGKNGEYRGSAIILATGMAGHPAIPGEEKFLGRGVSYCATCDGMFFRGKTVAVVAYLPEAVEEARFLAEICGRVYYLPQYAPSEEDGPFVTMRAKPLEILGAETVTGMMTDQGGVEVDAVFIEREALPIQSLLPGLAMEDGFIGVDRRLHTSEHGIFAAGDCTGRPWQIARAIGEGQVAALSAVDFLAEQRR